MAPTPHLCVNYYLCIQVPTYVPFVRDGPVGSLEKDLSSPQTASHPHQPSWHLAGCASFSAAPLYFPPQRKVQIRAVESDFKKSDKIGFKKLDKIGFIRFFNR